MPDDDLWYPGAIRNPAPTNLWGEYRDDDNQWKYLLHTTESTNFYPDDDSYYGHANYPHATAFVPTPGRPGVAGLYQHIPINRAARALKNKPGGVETNADRVVQIEIVGRAAQSPGFSTELLDLVRGFGLWVAEKTGMPWTCGVTFSAPGPPAAPYRLKPDVWDNYAGICGHQHCPENDHTDPGAINVAYILNGPAPIPQPSPQPEDDDAMELLVPQWTDKTKPPTDPANAGDKDHGTGAEFARFGDVLITLRDEADRQQLANTYANGDITKLPRREVEQRFWRRMYTSLKVT